MSSRDNKSITPRTAVVIADSFGEPFETIKRTLHPDIWRVLQSCGVDLFYAQGTIPNNFEHALNIILEKTRYTKLRPIQYFINRILLRRYILKLPEVQVEKNLIRVNAPEGLRFLGIKMVSSYLELYRMNYQVIFRTTLSSIVNTQQFIQFLNEVPQGIPFYGGRIIENGRSTFVSGASTFLNREALGLIDSRISSWDNGHLDDVALGKLLHDVARSNCESLNIDSVDAIEAIEQKTLLKTLHFRCKSSNKNRQDIEIMNALLVRLHQSNSG